MNKKIILVAGIFFFFAGMLQAKSTGIGLEIGADYTNHQIHTFGEHKNDGFGIHSIKFKHMGGFNLSISYSIPKNWALYASTTFAFNSVFVNDTQLGIGYNFAVGKGFNLFFGGGFAIGGAKFTAKIFNETKEYLKYTNIGGGLKLTASYMFTKILGVYFGTALNYYKPVKGYLWGTEVQSKDLPNISKSINVYAGLKIGL